MRQNKRYTCKADTFGERFAWNKYLHIFFFQLNQVVFYKMQRFPQSQHYYIIIIKIIFLYQKYYMHHQIISNCLFYGVSVVKIEIYMRKNTYSHTNY